jgi:hypothetical protein
MRMKYFWLVLNTALVVLAFRGGYVSMNPDRLRHTNPDATLCLIAVLITPPFTVGCVAYSIRRWKTDPLFRPSWSRNPFNWWGDPLQALFVYTWVMVAVTLGSGVQHPSFGSVGFWTLGVYSSVAIGLVAGQILVYRIYRQHIASR